MNKDNLTPLLLAEKPEPPPPPGNNTDSRTYRPKRNTRDEVIAALREAMGLKAGRPGAEAAAAAGVRAEEDRREEGRSTTRKWGRAREQTGTSQRRADLGRRRASGRASAGESAERAGADSRSRAPVTAAPRVTAPAPRSAPSPPTRPTVDKQKAWVKQVLRDVPQHAEPAAGQRSGQPRDGQSRRPHEGRRDLGARPAQAERARHAAAGHAASDRSELHGLHRLADHVARSRLAGQGDRRAATWCIGSTAPSIATPFAICWRSTSTSRRCCPTTAATSASTTSRRR